MPQIYDNYYPMEYYPKLENTYVIDINSTSKEMNKKEDFVGFDFDNVWEMSDCINDGLPYLKWIYDEDIKKYTIHSICVVNDNNKKVADITENCSAQINLTKNSILNSTDCLIIAMYDVSNKFLGFTHMKINMNNGQNITLSIPIPNSNANKIKAFMWDDISTMKPISNINNFE